MAPVDGKVVVNRCMSLDGFIAGPDHRMDWGGGRIGAAVATALDAAGGKDLEILGADVAGQCLGQRLPDEILVYCCRCCSAMASRSRPRDSPRSTWNR